MKYVKTLTETRFRHKHMPYPAPTLIGFMSDRTWIVFQALWQEPNTAKNSDEHVKMMM